MKSLAVADRYGYPRYVANQTYYSLIGSDYEWELMPLGLDQGLGALVWSPLGWGRLTGKIRRGQPLPKISRLHKTAEQGPPVRTNTCLRSSTRSMRSRRKRARRSRKSLSIGCSTVRRFRASSSARVTRDNLGAVGWDLTPEQIKQLDAASETAKAYPYWHQSGFAERNPPPVLKTP